MRKPFFKKSHGAWYVYHQGKMVRLDEDKEQAFLKYHELKASNAPASSGDSVASLLNSYLEWCKKNRSERTYDWYRYLLSSFAKSIGARLQIGSLKPLHVTQWLDNEEWNPTTQYNAVRAVKRAFNWAIKEGRLATNPLRAVERPAPNRRETFLTRSQFNLIFKYASDIHFRDYLTFLFETGSRPQEIKLIEAKHCDLETQRIVLPASRAKGKKHARVIYLTEPTLEIVSRLVNQFPIGKIFRNSDGQPWNKNSVNCRFRRIRTKLEKAGKPIEGLCATSLRHIFAREALKNGVDPISVSLLMGHADASQVAKTYQHLSADPEFLIAALKKANGQSG